MPGRWCKRFRQLARIAAFSESRCRNGRNRRLLRLQIARIDSTPCKGLGSSGKIPLSVRHGNSSDTTVRQSAIGKPAPLGEAALYLPVKRFFEKSGFDVKGEVNGCDLVAYRGDEPPVIVELKLRFTLALVLQGIDRLAISERVYLAVPRPPRRARGLSPEAPGVRRLCRRLGLGLLLVGRRSGTIAILEEPVPYRPRRSADRSARLLDEFTRRTGDGNIGGRNRTPIITAYREDALRCARALADGPMPLKALRAATGVADAAAILQRDVYGWFRRLGRGTYELTEAGQAALGQFAETVALLAASSEAAEAAAA